MNRKPLPRATGGVPVLSAEVWNYLCDLIEGAANLTVAAPLQMQQSPSGKMLSLGTVAGTSTCVRVLISSAASGGGKYYGRILTNNPTPVAATGDLTVGEMGTDPGVDNALVLNGAERGKSTHDLTFGTPVANVFVGYLTPTKSTGGLSVVVINGIDWENCVPS